MSELDQAIRETVIAARRVRNIVRDMNGWCGDNFDTKYGVTDEIDALDRAIVKLKAVVEEQQPCR